MAANSYSSTNGSETESMDPPAIAFKWTQARRLEFIDFRLSSDGRVNRSDLVDFFGISVPQASLDLARYLELVRKATPRRKNLIYNRHLKYYVRTEDFKPLFPTVSNPQSYLADLLALCRGELPQSRNFFGYVPNVGVATFVPPRRSVDPEILFNILEAIRCRMAVHVTYMSVSSDGDQSHLIAPHGLAYDGNRWHVRAYCYNRHGFRDFVLSRLLTCSAPDIQAPEDRFTAPGGNGVVIVSTSGRDDRDWNTLIDLVLCANPKLPERARRAVEMDYGMEENGTVVYTCRRALVFYTLQWLRLTPHDVNLPPECRQIVLDNEEEVMAVLENDNFSSLTVIHE